jgi:hypothetical protein
MKNTFNKCFLALFLTFWFLSSGFAQRNFVMVHGLGGGLKSQAPYANLFATRTMPRPNNTTVPSVNPINFEHNSAGGIVAAAKDAKEKAVALSVGRSAANRSNDIAIGHSMGGLTVREMDRQGLMPNQTKMFGGFIITGPPIHGSRMPTSFQNGSVQVFFNGLCKEAILDPTLSMVATLSSAFGPSPFATLANTLQIFDTQICDMLFKVVQKSETFASFQTGSINDFSMNADYLDKPMTGINSFTSATHKVCFMGNENGPVHWRLFSSFINTPNDGTLHDGTHDQIGVNLMQNVEDFELATGITASLLAMNCCFEPALWSLVAPLGNMSFQFCDGYFWLLQSESQYNNLIGAFGTFNELQTISVFDCFGQRGSLESQYQSGQISMTEFFMRVSALYSNPNCSHLATVTVQVPLNGQSDAVVPLESQRLKDAAVNVTVDGVNHFELRDHPKMTVEYNKLFVGQTPMSTEAARQFFITQ